MVLGDAAEIDKPFSLFVRNILVDDLTAMNK